MKDKHCREILDRLDELERKVEDMATAVEAKVAFGILQALQRQTGEQALKDKLVELAELRKLRNAQYIRK